MKPSMEYCDIGTNIQYYLIAFNDTSKMQYYSIKECDFCKVKIESNDTNYNNFQAVWNGDFCVAQCYRNEFRDLNTGTCWTQNYTSSLSLPNSQILFNTTKVSDSYSCGDGIVSFARNEICEKFGLAENSNCD